MRVGLLTREYPPDVYGGAGVHVEFLARELRALVDLDVHCWGEGARGRGASGTAPWPALDGANDALRTFSVDLVHRRRASKAANWSTPTPGTPTSPATSASCCTASRTS